MTGQYQQMSKNTLTSQEQQQTVSQLAQGKRQNSTVRNMLPVRKTLASETFDIIRHGPALKDKSPEVSPTRISNISYQESIIAQQYQLKPLNTFANIMPYSPQQQQDEFQDEDQQLFATGNNMHHMSLMSNGLVNSSTNVGSNGIPRRSNNPIPGPNNALSPFEQFLQNLMKQNELEKSSYQQVQRLNPNQFIQMQQPLEIQKRQRQMDNVIKKNTLSAQNSGKYSDKRIDDYYGSASTNSQSMTQVPPSQIANLQSKQRGMNKYGYPESVTNLEKINVYNNNVLGGIALAPSSSQVGNSQNLIMDQIDNQRIFRNTSAIINTSKQTIAQQGTPLSALKKQGNAYQQR